ncbi:MAG TPA: DUF4214 domain-containing protein [Bacillota bacterium]|nr:DUF4214 domain-containing protein [Bacillota bacterium]
MKRFRLGSMLLCAAMVVSMLPSMVAADGEVAINSTNFPDETFRNYVARYFDDDNNDFLSATEIDAVTEIEIHSYSVNDLTGIEKFSQLTKLDCDSSLLTELDVTQNRALTELDCGYNHLTTLDVSQNTALTYLDCWNNNLTELDVTHNTALTYLNCGENLLCSLNVTQNTALTALGCYGNNLTELDITKNSALINLGCFKNSIIELDITRNTALIYLRCDNNPITSLDISRNWSLRVLDCEDTNLVELDIHRNSLLMDCFSNGRLPDYNDYQRYDDGDNLFAVPNSTTIITEGPTIPMRPWPNISLSYDFIARCYTYALDREPEDPGFSSWVNKLVNQEICGSEMAYGFVFSQEFQNAGYSNDEYVEHMYQIFFGRPSDAPGKQTWVNMLNNGSSREEVFAGFTNSTEFITMCYEYGINPGYYVQGVNWEQQTKVNAFVDRLYGFCLGRNGDFNGQKDWVTMLMNGSFSGAQVAHGFFFSNEFINKNYSDEVYITLLYKVILNRDVDEGGYATWMNELAAGTSRLDVFRGFVNSVEFTNLCNDYGIQRGTI